MRRNLLVLVILTVCVSQSLGHNWLYNPSRSQGIASTFFPSPSRTADVPHIQLRPGQEFQLEWASGHGGFSYFVLLKREDEIKMRAHSYELLDNYLSTTGGGNKINDYERFHRNTPEVNKGVVLTMANGDGLFTGTVAGVSRPSRFIHDEKEYTNWRHTSAARSEDVVKIGSNSEYPWIEAIWKYKIDRHDPFNTDYAVLKMPEGLPFGDYVIHWLWRGYYDAVDINYVDFEAGNTNPIAEIYGVDTGEITFTRIDHCYYPEIRGSIEHPTEVVNGDTNWCRRKCAGRTSCNGYQVVPYPVVTSNIRSSFRINGTINWDELGWNDYESQFANELAPGEKTQICYMVKARYATDTKSQYITTEDPRDPAFYTTCYKKNVGIQFENFPVDPEPANSPVPWKYQDFCISCEDQATINAHPEQAPTWRITKSCSNCDINPVAPRIEERNLIAEARCDGLGSWKFPSGCPAGETCHKRLYPIARLDGEWTYRNECLAMARRDPECSNIVMSTHPSKTQYQCNCFKALDCCKCSTIKNSPWNEMYELESPRPDPTCSNGVPNGDNTVCCHATCARCHKWDRWGSTSEGYCNGDPTEMNPERTCDQFGAPCLM